MADVPVEIKVETTEADLDLDDAFGELRLKVRWGANPCMRCSLNEDPKEVPLHPRCQCAVVVERSGSIIDALR